MKMSDINWLRQINSGLEAPQHEDERFSLFLQSIVMDFGFMAGNEAASADDTQIYESESAAYEYTVEWECMAE
jgi:hypothetical protein